MPKVMKGGHGENARNKKQKKICHRGWRKERKIPHMTTVAKKLRSKNKWVALSTVREKAKI